MKYIFCDTSALMHSPEEIDKLLERENAHALISSVVLDELDNHKDYGNGERNYMARQAFKLINKLEDEGRILTAIKENAVLPDEYDMSIADNKILACVLEMQKMNKLFDIQLLTYDNGMKAKAKALGVPTISIVDEEERQGYKGYIEIYGTEDEIDEQLLDLIDSNKLKVNQYVIMYEREDDSDEYTVYTARWDGRDFQDTLMPSNCPIKPLNGPQQCAIDLMYNKNIPIKIICGGYGAGKTMIAVKCAENMVNKCFYNKLMLVRNPIPADDIDIGALPGDKHAKVGSYFKSMTQYLTDYSNGMDIDSFDPNNEEAAKRRGYELIMEIPSFMKGMSVLDTIMIVDECEDLNVKLIKMLGTRVGKNSAVVFTGDYHQSEKKYRADSGMNKMIECLKGDPLVGIVVLEEDVRSSVSKLFANID